jgi:putative endonuclease
MARHSFIYILSSLSRTTYTDVTNDLLKRVAAHRAEVGSRFTAKYRIHRLVYFEMTENPYAAISREKQIKAWRREKKVALIERNNPDWRHSAVDWFEER